MRLITLMNCFKVMTGLRFSWHVAIECIHTFMYVGECACLGQGGGWLGVGPRGCFREGDSDMSDF